MITITNHQESLQILDNKRLKKILMKALRTPRLASMLTSRQTVDFHLFDKESMAEMNGSYLQHEGPTDVITFSYLNDSDLPVEDDESTAGEIFVCPSVAAEAAAAYGQPLDVELILYFVHGLLHLSGLDDQTDDERLIMRQAESTVMDFIKDDIMSGPLFLLVD